jgi:hypothetical protein
MSTSPFPEYRNTPLWRAVASIVKDLQVSREVALGTAPEYVIGYVCRELAAKRLVTDVALAHEKGR